MGRPRKQKPERESATPSSSALDHDDPSQVSHGGDSSYGSTVDDHYSHEGTATLQWPSFSDWTLPPVDVAASHDDYLQYEDPGALINGMNLMPPGPQAFDPSLEGLPQTSMPNAMPAQGVSSMSSENMMERATMIGNVYAAKGAARDFGNTGEPCSCLSNMYLSTVNLDSTRHSGFPFALSSLKESLIAAKGILFCDKCPNTNASCRQNVMLLTSLLSSVAVGFDELLQQIDAEAMVAAAAGVKKPLAMGDTSVTNVHLHTGTDDCPGRFSVELEPEEWSTIAKRVVKKSIYGYQDNALTLEGLVMSAEARQRAWHSTAFNSHAPGMHHDEREWTCLRLFDEVKRLISQLPP